VRALGHARLGGIQPFGSETLITLTKFEQEVAGGWVVQGQSETSNVTFLATQTLVWCDRALSFHHEAAA
jgi:hypothetical protein